MGRRRFFIYRRGSGQVWLDDYAAGIAQSGDVEDHVYTAKDESGEALALRRGMVYSQIALGETRLRAFRRFDRRNVATDCLSRCTPGGGAGHQSFGRNVEAARSRSRRRGVHNSAKMRGAISICPFEIEGTSIRLLFGCAL